MKAVTRPALAVSDIRKSFAPIEVLKGVSFAVAPGKVVSIIGASGSGKSTLLQCLNFLEKPTSGKAPLGDEVFERTEFASASRRSRARLTGLRRRMRMVFQSFNLGPQRSALENAMEGPIHALGRSQAEVESKALELLAIASRRIVREVSKPTSALDPEFVGGVSKSFPTA
ncbi:ATP-binding cassette domain-containing protein [Ensifer sp. LCM 4579]|uniref:ATP-binding cassette domain-containing protein n=1 Tax=Ensifer sp. LCM 4579 TaxID=1848292 RepID=UPI0008D93ED8|nr:ATP-binding cassette domain-containing protein [Ensifer sp. LCM 4579]OHV78900.1 hypothetical protein LCM4579_24730 [Ensifer sp. LCM 4579]